MKAYKLKKDGIFFDLENNEYIANQKIDVFNNNVLIYLYSNSILKSCLQFDNITTLSIIYERDYTQLKIEKDINNLDFVIASLYLDNENEHIIINIL